MYGDTEVMRRHAGRLRDQGADIRALADSLVSQVEHLRWSGRAAEAMRERARERAGRLREAASRHESAADTLDSSAHEVDGLKETIEDIETRALGAGAEAPGGFEPPPSGHRDWLAISLPGL